MTAPGARFTAARLRDRARRGYTIAELLFTLTFVVLFALVVAPLGLRMGAARAELAAYGGDLERAARVADAIGREVRRGRRVVAASPDGAVRSGPAALVLADDDGGAVALAFEAVADRARGQDPERTLGRALLLRYPPGAEAPVRTDLGLVGGLTFRLELRPGPAAVGFDVRLPSRGPSAAPVALSSLALVGAGEAP